MKVALKRNLILGGNRYRADPDGVEVPDYVDGKKVVFKKDWNPGDEESIPLPSDAELWVKPVENIKDLHVKSKASPKTLSEMSKAEAKTGPLGKPA
jgi:hypothetical protein